VNVLVVMSDTFRRDHLGAYGLPAPWSHPGHEGEPFVDTPNLDALAEESALFDRFYVSSYPTIPCRYDLFSGRFGFTTRGWQPLEPQDVVLSELAGANGLTPMIIFDTPMLATDSYNYTRGFAGWDFVRGQHADRYVVDPISVTLPAQAHKVKSGTAAYLRNTAFRRDENDWMCAQTCSRAMDWLERNRTRDDFVLWIDLWDPHEPFDAPERDLRRYVDPRFDGDRIIYPRYGRADYMNDAERDFVRASYAALATLVDRWVGRLLDKLSEVGLDDNTLVVFVSDHGHLFGEHELQGKPSGPLGKLYEVTTRVPLLVRHPEGLGAGTRVQGIAQHTDLLPTVLDFLDVPTPDGVHGRSLWPLIRGEVESVREFAVSGRHAPLAVAGQLARAVDAASFDGQAGLQTQGEPITITTEEWAYLAPPAGLGAAELYHLPSDPAQAENVIERHPDVAAELRGTMTAFLAEHGMAEALLELYEPGLNGGRRTELLSPQTPLHVARSADGLHAAFLAADDANACFGVGNVQTMSFAELRRDHPRALVHFDDQYYWAEDLA
jgi:arylsulfatase A-like enzyme